MREMKEMRRIERMVTDEAKIDEIIMSCDCCRLGMIDEDEVYIVPLNFGYRRENGVPVFYFHGAAEGRKVELLKKNGKCGFELDTKHGLTTGDVACSHSFDYQSVIGTGKVTFIEEAEKKIEAFKVIMKHYTGKDDWEFLPEALKATALIRVEAEAMSCKEH